METLLATPDQQTPQGRRDYALLVSLYNTGARRQRGRPSNYRRYYVGQCSRCTAVGKGNKVRWCPIWPHTEEMLKCMVAGRAAQEIVFLSRVNQPLTRFGIYRLVQRTVEQASQSLPSLKPKRISPIAWAPMP